MFTLKEIHNFLKKIYQKYDGSVKLKIFGKTCG